MAAVNAEAVLLSRRNISEADRLLTFYTRELGKMRLRAAGLRKPSARLASMLEPFSHLEISLTLRPGQTVGRLINARLLFSGAAMSQPLERFSAACLISEVANRFTAEADKNPGKFDLIQRAFERLLMESGSSGTIACQFALQFLRLAGHGLHLVGCRHCAAPDFFYLSPREGGLVCRKHRGEGAGLAVSNEEIERLTEFMGRPIGEASAANDRLLRIVLFYLQNLLGEPLSSAEFVLKSEKAEVD